MDKKIILTVSLKSGRAIKFISRKNHEDLTFHPFRDFIEWWNSSSTAFVFNATRSIVGVKRQEIESFQIAFSKKENYYEF